MENNVIINNVVDEILINETQKLSDVREAPEFFDSGCEMPIYIRLIKRFLKRLNKNFNDVSVRLNVTRRINMGFKSEII